MDVVSLCPLQVGKLIWQPRRATHSMTVVAKATFELMAGEARLCTVQDFPNDEDNHWNDDPNCSLYSASDLVPFKARADVVLVGDAFCPSPAQSVVARLIVGSIDKSLEVSCDRHLDQQGNVVTGKRFTRMSLRYERAAKGRDNPVGVDREADPDNYGRRTLPNLQPPGLNVVDGTTVIEPVGFGPIAETWGLRRARLGKNANWRTRDWRGEPLPGDMDGAFFNCAPLDQTVGELRNNERIVLENMHPDQPRLVCQLPGMRPRAFARLEEAVREVPMSPDTLWIDTARGVFTMTWRGRVKLDSPTQPGRVIVAVEEPGHRVTWQDVATMLPELDGVSFVEPTADDHAPETLAGPPAGLGPTHDLDENTAVGMPALRDRALPFVDTPSSPPLVPPKPLSQRVHRATASMEAVTDISEPMVRPSPDLAPEKMPRWLHKKSDLAALERHAVPPPTPPPPAAATPATAAAPDTGTPAASPWARKGSDDPDSPDSPEPAIAIVPVPVPAHESPPVLTKGNGEARPSATDATSAERLAARTPREVVELIWYDQDHVAAVRQRNEWHAILYELYNEEGPIDFDEDPVEDEPVMKERRDVVAVMTRSQPATTSATYQHMRESVDDAGSFSPPLVLLSGRIAFPFDPVESLKAMIAAVTPFLGANKPLDETVTAVEELLKTPWLQSSGDVTEGLTEKIRAAFKQGNHAVKADYLDDHTRRMLLEGRHYQKRTVFGDEWLRALMMPSLSKTGIPSYLPHTLDKELPMFEAFDARIIAEAHVQQDQFETHECALKVVALGRIVRLPS